jgi:hypothetical protein
MLKLHVTSRMAYKQWCKHVRRICVGLDRHGKGGQTSPHLIEAEQVREGHVKSGSCLLLLGFFMRNGRLCLGAGLLLLFVLGHNGQGPAGDARCVYKGLLE